MVEVNCLLKAVAICLWSVRWVLLNLISWLGACGCLFPDKFLRRDQKCEVLCLCEQLSTVCVHVLRLDVSMSCVMCWSRVLMRGLVGSVERRRSRSRMSCLVLSVRFGMKSGLKPVGINLLDAVWRIFRSWGSPELAEEGASRRATASSTIRV